MRFLATIFTAMAAMYVTTYLNSYELSHAHWSETRVFMTLLMGSSMAIIMLAFMRQMFDSWKVIVAIALGSLMVFGSALYLVRSQTTVQDQSYMNAMVPHHSIAILTSENSEIADVRVCQLAVGIIESQKREIAEMKWLIDDIRRNGPALNEDDAERRKVPRFEGKSDRRCPQ